jgi:hypothetical protein
VLKGWALPVYRGQLSEQTVAALAGLGEALSPRSS